MSGVSSVSLSYSQPVAFRLLLFIVSMQREPISWALKPKLKVDYAFADLLRRKPYQHPLVSSFATEGYSLPFIAIKPFSFLKITVLLFVTVHS